MQKQQMLKLRRNSQIKKQQKLDELLGIKKQIFNQDARIMV